MTKLIHLWVVHYRLENGKNVKTKFFTFENKGTKEIFYKIKNEELKIEKVVTKDEGNNYFLSLLNYDKEAMVNKIC